MTPQYFYFELYTRAEQGQFFSVVRLFVLLCLIAKSDNTLATIFKSVWSGV